ncbi:surface protease GP63, partial [Trypanosoma theileri]
MRHLLYVTVLLLVLLPLYCTNGLAATGGRSCGFDAVRRRRGNTPVAVVRELPVKGQGPWQAYTAATYSPWAPIRILVSTIDLEDDSRHCTAFGQLRPDFEFGQKVCLADHVLTNEKRNALINHIIPGAVKLHQDRLLVKPLKHAFQVPNFSLGHPCSAFSIPKDHYNPGISGYDTVMYAAAGPSHLDGNVAWAILCATLANSRPVTGVMHLAPESITNTSQMVRVVAHEMAHILGFDREVFSANKMITLVHDVRGKSNVHMLTSEKVMEKAREHYNCSSLDGIEMEKGEWQTSLSHWERRSAKDELMTGITGIGYYTALTMAAFEGTNHYKANWGMEETMSWGKNAGCSFHTEKCIERGTTKFPDFFCTAPSKTPVCTSDRRALGECVLFKYNFHLRYQYFEDKRVGGRLGDMTDLCPIISPIVDGDCNIDIANAFPGSRTGPSSWCLKGESLVLNGKMVGDVCAEVQCDGKSVQVRYYGDDKWYPCPEGKVLKPNNTFTSGSIVCPKYREVCTIAADGSSRIVKKIIPEARHSSDTESSMGPTANLVSGNRGNEGNMTDKKKQGGFIEKLLAALSTPFLFLLALFSNIS